MSRIPNVVQIQKVERLQSSHVLIPYLNGQVRIQRGDRGSGPPPPPRKSQVIWVSIGNKQLDPLEKVGPPKKMLDPLLNLEK